MMDKRVYGVLGISSIMANWNADFSGYPKTTSDGSTFGSDKAFKYPMKRMWEEQGKKVVYIKSLRLNDDKKGTIEIIPRTLKERYEQLFQVESEKNYKDAKAVLTNLFQAVDIKNFGATFAEAGMNISITGAVQFGQGFNQYEGTEPQEQSILSPFRDPKAKEKNDDGKEAKNSTLGTKIVSNEAHYFYPFSINPMVYKDYMELGVTEGYTQEDYDDFKKTALCAATSFATNAKAGCENEFGLFVETDSDLYLPILSKYIEFLSGEGRNQIRINCGELLNQVKDKIKTVEVYYNPHTTKITFEGIEGVRYFNIFTQKEV